MGDMSEPVAWMRAGPNGGGPWASDVRLPDWKVEMGWTERALVYADDLDAMTKERDEALAALAREMGVCCELSEQTKLDAMTKERDGRDEIIAALENELTAAEARIAELEAQLEKSKQIGVTVAINSEMHEHRAKAAEARIKVLTEALAAAQKTMRNCWGAVTSNQVTDKDVEGQLKQGLAALASLEPK